MNLQTILKNQVVQYLLEHPIDDAAKNKYADVTKKFNIDIKTASRYWIEVKEQYRGWQDSFVLPEVNYTEQEVKKILKQEGDNLSVSLRSDVEVKSLDDLLAICEVDESVWEVVSWQCKKWDLGVKNKEEKIETKPLFSVSAKFRQRKVETDLKLQKDVILKELFAHSPDHDILNTFGDFMGEIERPNKKYLLELSIPDLHIGKLAHREESGEDYDLKIAVDRYKTAVRELIGRINVDQVERILLPIGNDIIQVDNGNNTTTAGTRVDTDGRYFKIVRTVKQLLIETIDALTGIAPVDVVVIPGNHDSESSFMIGEILDAYYHNAKRVNIYNDASLRKYYQYGLVSMLYTHGDKEKHGNLGMIFAAENPKLWADTKYRFIKLGHLHHNKKIEYISNQEYQGFQLQILPSLSSNDAWHKNKGFLSLKQAKSFLYHVDEGLVGEFTFSV